MNLNKPLLFFYEAIIIKGQDPVIKISVFLVARFSWLILEYLLQKLKNLVMDSKKYRKGKVSFLFEF